MIQFLYALCLIQFGTLVAFVIYVREQRRANDELRRYCEHYRRQADYAFEQAAHERIERERWETAYSKMLPDVWQ